MGWLSTTFDGLVGPAPSEFISQDDTLFGWVVGGGLETKVTENFHIKGEYLYGQFEDGQYDLSPTGGCGTASCVVDMNVDDFHTVRIGASYNFNFGGGYTAAPTKW